MPFWRCDSQRRRRDPGARALVRAAYIGELGKLALTVLFFSMVFHAGTAALRQGALFAGFIAAQLAIPLQAS